MAYKGTYQPVNKEKYKGDWSKITYRSSWEGFLMKWCDTNPNVKRWNSEEVVIPYFSNADGKKRRYFMDFYVEMQDGSVYLLEVKPKKETQPPRKPVRNTAKAKQTFASELYTYTVNIDKWKAASKLCEQRNWTFRIVTEDSLKKLGWKG